MDESLKKDLISELGLDKLPEAERDEALRRMGDIIFQSVLVRALDSMDEAGRKELENFMETPSRQNDPDALYGFLKNKVPNLDELVAEEIATFKGGVAKLDGAA